MEADDQSIQTIFLVFLKDINAAVDSCRNCSDQPSPRTYCKQPQPINNNNNPHHHSTKLHATTNCPNPEDHHRSHNRNDIALALMQAFKLNYSTPTNNNQRISSNPRNRQIAQPGMNIGQDRQMRMNVGNQLFQDAVQIRCSRMFGNQNGLLCCPGITNQNQNEWKCLVARQNCTVRPRRRDAAYLQTQLLIAQKEEARNRNPSGRVYLMVAAADHDEIEEVNCNLHMSA
ncbi:hypothetical protein Tco_0820802 [Tanacetum coccineum]|uniref:Uncharacterized protein n=1 Tax=Tanacetum coccineum TaxID=301880 RepID=A0ABQ5ABD8_9ASTR